MEYILEQEESVSEQINKQMTKVISESGTVMETIKTRM